VTWFPFRVHWTKIAAFDALPTNDPDPFEPVPQAAAPRRGSNSKYPNARLLITRSIHARRSEI
jgi:hypothetical protein